jgi:hypothetical protein
MSLHGVNVSVDSIDHVDNIYINASGNISIDHIGQNTSMMASDLILNGVNISVHDIENISDIFIDYYLKFFNYSEFHFLILDVCKSKK